MDQQDTAGSLSHPSMHCSYSAAGGDAKEDSSGATASWRRRVLFLAAGGAGVSSLG